jgi:hypothetical protein
MLLSGVAVELFVRRPLMMMAHALTRFAKGRPARSYPRARREIGRLASGVALVRT